MGRFYKQGQASLTTADGESMVFPLNPASIQWGFQVNTAEFDTVGGRVIQVLGANLSDLTVQGQFGTDKGNTPSWGLAESFLLSIQAMVESQSENATISGRTMKPALTFSFPPKGWLFDVYIKSLSDGQGGLAITHNVGKFSYDYVLTFSVLNDLTNASRIIGQGNDQLKQVQNAAVNQYINEIAQGIQWKVSNYNGMDAAKYSLAQQLNVPASGTTATPSKPPPKKTGGGNTAKPVPAKIGAGHAAPSTGAAGA